MIKNMIFNKEKGSVAIYAIATIFCFVFILSGLFFATTSIRKNQLRTILKIKEIYAQDIEESARDIRTDSYVQDGLVVFYDSINNTGNGHSNTTKIWKDLSGNGNNAKWNGTGELTWNEKAYDFIEPNSNFFETLNSISLGETSRTIEIVCSFEENDVGNLIGLGTEADYTLSNLSYINNGINIYYKNIIPDEGISNSVAELGKIYANAITYDSSNNMANFYLNSNSDSISKTDVEFGHLNTGTSILTLGKGVYQTQANTGKRFKLHALRIYDHILTNEERISNYVLDKERYEI